MPTLNTLDFNVKIMSIRNWECSKTDTIYRRILLLLLEVVFPYLVDICINR